MTAAAVLARLRDLGVTAEARGDRLALRPASAVPSDLLADLRQHKADLLTLLAVPANDPAPVFAELAGACETRTAALAGAYDAPDALDDRAAIAAEVPGTVASPSIPAADMVGALALALADRAEASGAVRFNGGREAAMHYFRGQARNRLAATNDPMARGLLLGWERHQTAMVEHGRPTR